MAQSNSFLTDLENLLAADMIRYSFISIMFKERFYLVVRWVSTTRSFFSVQMLILCPDPYVVEGGMSLSPPFIMSMAMSNTGVLAAGTADGRLWLGFKGDKVNPGKGSKKKSKKWEGLDEDEALLIKVAEGPIVAMLASILLSRSLTETSFFFQGILGRSNVGDIYSFGKFDPILSRLR